jgi:hypothetical protein
MSRILTDSGTTVVNYTVTVLAEGGSSDVLETLADSLIDQLEAEVEAGNLTTFILEFAEEDAVVALESATAATSTTTSSLVIVSVSTDAPTASPTAEPTATPTEDGDSDDFFDKKGHLPGVIIAVVVVFLLIVSAIVAVFVFKKHAASTGPNDEDPPAVPPPDPEHVDDILRSAPSVRHAIELSQREIEIKAVTGTAV